MLELFIVFSDDLLIYEFVGVKLIYFFREFTKPRRVLYLNFILAYHHIDTGPAYQMKYVTISNPYWLFSMFNEQTYTQSWLKCVVLLSVYTIFPVTFGMMKESLH
jgi:hypothetical protein